MKTCPTCGNTAEEQASFCPCCGTSFVVRSIAPPPPPPVATPPQPAVVPPFFKEEKEKKGGHALPIVIISVLATLTVTLATLWLSGGLAAMLGKETAPADTAKKEEQSPALQLNSTPQVAATYGNGQELTTEQYLAYLYLTYEETYNTAYAYYNAYAQYTGTFVDPLTQTYTYEDEEELSFYDYVVRLTHDNIKTCIVLNQTMKDNGIAWDAEDEAEFNKSMATLQKNAFVDLGFSNEAYVTAAKNLQLGWSSTFYGLYKPGGVRGVSELDLRQYFVQNYVSYKMIAVAMTDSTGKALDKEGDAYRQIMAHMEAYLDVYETEGFEAAYATYEKDANALQAVKQAAAGGNVIPTYTVTPSDDVEDDHEHSLRNDVDASDPDRMDPALKDAIMGKKGADGQWVGGIEVGECQIVEITSGGVPYAVMLERLDPDKDDEGKRSTLFEDSVESMIYEMHYETFYREVDTAVQRLQITFDETLVANARPEDFAEIVEK